MSSTSYSSIIDIHVHDRVFLSDFHDRALREAARGEHFAGAREYKMYLQKLQQDAALSLHYGGSLRYENSGQLVRCGLAHTSAGFERFVSEAAV